MAPPSPRPGPRVHGGALSGELAALGIDPAAVLDLSVNVNPYGPCPAVLAAIRAAPVHLYPDPTAAAVRRAVAARTGAAPEGVVFGAGAAELLWTLARVAVPAGGTVLVVEPAFSEVRAAAEAAGARVLALRAPVEAGLEVDLGAVEAAARRARPALLSLCVPTSPAGLPLSHEGVAALARRLPETPILLDESFLSLSDLTAEAGRPLPGSVLRLRSLTKAHAIPGLRAGYLLAPPALCAALEAGRPPWSTGAAAQAAALAALDAEPFVAESRARLRLDREATAALLRAHGFAPLPSVAPYLLFPAADAPGLRRRLLARGVLLRDCASFGLPGWLRVAARPAADRARLEAALAAARER